MGSDRSCVVGSSPQVTTGQRSAYRSIRRGRALARANLRASYGWQAKRASSSTGESWLIDTMRSAVVAPANGPSVEPSEGRTDSVRELPDSSAASKMGCPYPQMLYKSFQ